MLAWRLLHDPRLAATPGWLTPLLPRPAGALDRDPVALLLGALAVGLALAYLVLAARGARPRARALIVVLAALLLVIGPTAAFVAMGAALDRPYGQDGGVVQLPLAIDRILAGKSPYGADYSDSILGKQARVSTFWDAFGGNPILRHHAYLPGTHLIVAPFYLASRALGGFFDPRLVTVLAYLAAIALALRLIGDPFRRLAAAAIAALNPLVYWHQIFGANDVFIVALLLGAVLLARAQRPLLSGAVLGFACATKQLAWPFAPFLLLHLSGARSLRELLGRAAMARLTRPLLAAASVFALVVAPVAALDLSAFWGDIVVYNVGLPGADNYPLGGTPGFGVGNFLIYFGRVASLGDYFPFGLFYVLLVPLVGLLLVRQLREGDAAAALLNGSVALLATVYLSRVVHPNYLVPAAILLPLSILALRRAADLALVPLGLLLVAVEIAENAVFRATWDQAVAARVPQHLPPALAALAPRAGPSLTSDPLGLLVSAAAAGLGVLYLAAAGLGASSRVRALGVTVAATLVVAVPTLVVIQVGERTGVPRGQEAWIVQVPADANRLSGGRSPYTPPAPETPAGREAWATSFRLEPPRLLTPDRPVMPPGPTVLAAALRPLNGKDPRWLCLLALLAASLILGRWVGPEGRPMALALATLAPPLALGSIFGSPAALIVAALAASFLAATRGRFRAAGALAGVAVALDHLALLAAPFALLRAGSRRRAFTAATLAYGLPVFAVAILDLGAFAARLTSAPPIGPGLGLANVFLYRGLQDGVAAHAVFALAPAILGLGVLLLLRSAAAPPLLLGAIATLGGLWLAREAPVEAMAVPMLLAALAVTLDGGESQTDGRAPTSGGGSSHRGERESQTATDRLESTAIGDSRRDMPEAGLEPARVSPHAPQTCVSANSTTPARKGGRGTRILSMVKGRGNGQGEQVNGALRAG